MTTNYNDEKSCSVWKKMLTTGFWVIYPIMGICFLHVLWLMNDRMDDIMVNTTEVFEEPEPFKDIDGPVRGNVIKGLDVALLKEPSEAMKKRGAEIYAAKCIACHGSNGNNGLPNARKFDKDPFKNGREMSGVFKSITVGIAPAMPPFDTETVEDRVALSHYVRSFSKESPAVTDEDIKKLDKEYAVTTDKGAPHRVPVDMAINILIEESKDSVTGVKYLLRKVKKDKSSDALLLKSVSNDLRSTLVSFSNNDIWKGDLKSFAKFVSVNIQSNGLESKALIMSEEKLKTLHQYLTRLYQ